MTASTDATALRTAGRQAHRARAWAGLVAGSLLALSPHATPAQAPAQPAAGKRAEQPVTVEASSSEFDYRKGQLVFRNVKVTQGDTIVEAVQANATGLEFQNSRWSFTGSVRVAVPGGFLTSDQATVSFSNNVITRVEILGKPAQFEQRREDQLARGRADRIDYDVTAATVKLAGSAWLSDGRNEIRGQTLVFDTRDQRVVADAAQQGDGRVRITITPQSPPGQPTQPKQ